MHGKSVAIFFGIPGCAIARCLSSRLGASHFVNFVSNEKWLSSQTVGKNLSPTLSTDLLLLFLCF